MKTLCESYDDQNIFARILRKEIPTKTVHETPYALAFHDIAPQAPVHVLVIPKIPCNTFHTFTKKAHTEAQVGFWRGVSETIEKLNIAQKGYRLILNNGADAGQEVPHLHVHILAGEMLPPLLVKA